MRLLRLLIPALAMLLPGIVSSQIVFGTVTDANNGFPLVSANITIDSSGIGAVSDIEGNFLLEGLSPGRYTLLFSYIGYGTVKHRIDLGNEDVRVDIALNPIAFSGPEIEISAYRAKPRYSPVTFTGIDRKHIEENYFVQDIPVLLSNLPSATYYSEGGNGIGYNYLKIRGFGQRRLAIMINGIPQNDPEDHNVYWLDFADLLGSTKEIQVQRGAGSAFYGPPAIGGSINIVTGDFADRKGISISTGYGGFIGKDTYSVLGFRRNTQRYSVSFGSGLIDDRYTIFGRMSTLSSDGYREHSWVRANSYYFAATRYDSELTTRINVYGGPVTDGLVYTGLPRFSIEDRNERRKNYNYWEADENGYTYTQKRRPQEIEEFSQPHFELLNEWKINSRLTINNAVFYVLGQGYFDYDGTGYTNAAYYRLTPEFGFQNVSDPVNPIIRAYVDNRQIGWLPRITLTHGEGTLTAGLELRTHRSVHWGKIRWAEGLPADLDPDRKYYEYSGGKDIVSVYAQEIFRLSSKLLFMGNLQYSFKTYHLFDEKYVGTDFSIDYHFVNPRFGINYNIDEDWNFYGNISYTSREPRLKNLYDAAESSGGAVPLFAVDSAAGFDFRDPLVQPEQLLNIEVGTGYSDTDAHVLLNGYLMDFKDEIVKSGQLDRFGQPVTGNAERTLHLGIELSARMSVSSELECTFNGLLSRSRLKSYTVWKTDPSTNILNAVSLAGNRIAGFPENLANLGLTWKKGGFSVSVLWKYVGEQYTDNHQNEATVVPSYTVLDGILAYRMPSIFGLRSLFVRLAVNNMLDQLYAQSGEGMNPDNPYDDQYFVGAVRNFFFDVTFEL